jgi:hypothetical protein
MNTPSPEHPKYNSSDTEALDTVLYAFDGPGDATRRPRRPEIPLTPPDRPLPRKPGDEKEPPDAPPQT